MMSEGGGAAGARVEVFGRTPDGRDVPAVTLADGTGHSARIIALGATLQAMHVPDAAGRAEDVVLGYDAAERYAAGPRFFGPVAGRVANRIAGAAFSLDGRRHRLDANAGRNTLHGGRAGFDKALWRIGAVEDGAAPAVTLHHVSPDGDGGFPGRLEVAATYRLVDGALTLTMTATTDAATVVNLTGHTYFNLAGAGSRRSVLEHRLALEADAYTPIDATQVPTGEIRPVAETSLDFRAAKAIGRDIRDGTCAQLLLARGYDHNFVLRGGRTAEPKPAARLHEPRSGRVLEVSTTEPGLQIYSGNMLDGSSAGKGGVAYRSGDGICLETQTFPNAPNIPGFPSAVLRPGDTYRHVCVYRFTAEAAS